MTEPSTHVPGGASPAREQRRLDAALRVGGVLVAVGLVTVVVILTLDYLGAPMPGTWAYGVVLLAPLGFAVILVALAGVAVRRRRDAVRQRPRTD